MIVILIFCLTGCWDSTETEKLGVVTLMGIGLDNDNNIEVTIQEIGEKGNPFIVYNESASSVSKAVRKIAVNQHHRIYFGHTKIIILSEELVTSRGLMPVIDFFERDQEVRPTTKVLISKGGQLTRILSTDMGFNSDTGTILEETIKSKKNTQTLVVNNIKNFVELLSTPGCEVYTSGIGLKAKNSNIQQSNSIGSQNEIFDFEDIAVFKGTKMADFLKGDEFRGFLWVKGNASGSLITVPFENESISFKIIRIKSIITPSINNNKMDINIAIKIICNIEESQHNIDFFDEAVINKMEQVLNKQIKDEVLAAVNKSRNIGDDIFGFGNYFYANYPIYWMNIKANENSYYQNINVDISVNSTIRNLEIIYKSLPKQ